MGAGLDIAEVPLMCSGEKLKDEIIFAVVAQSVR
jgi:hypothetical protein